MNDTATTDTVVEDKPTFEVGSWQDTLAKSSVLFDRSAKGKAKASQMLWDGAQAGIEAWLTEADADVSGEGLYSDLIEAMTTSRKGDASKIKTVALAVKNNGLVLSLYPNLSKAYGEATRLTKTVKAQADEDAAADAAVANIKAPKNTGTAEGAALLVLSKGVDEAARLLLDALGTDSAVHRAFLRAVSQEIAGRVPKPQPKAPSTKAKGAAKKAVAGQKAKPKATVKDGAAKAKPSAAPVEAEKATAEVVTKAKPAQPEAEVNEVETPEVPVKRAAVKGKPVVVRRAG